MKLTDIRQRGVGSAPQIRSPGTEVAKFRQKQDIAQQVYNLGDAIGEVKVEHDVNKANSAYRKSVLDYKELTADRAYATPDELKAMGIAGDVDMTDGNGKMLEQVPKWKWYSVGLDAHMKEGLETAGGMISSGKARNGWETEVRRISDQELARSIDESGQMAIKHEYDMAIADYKIAVATNDFDGARDLLDSPIISMDAAAKKVLTTELNQGEEMYGLESRMITGDYQGVMDEVSNFERETYLSAEQSRRVYFAAESRMLAEQTAADDAMKSRQEGNYMDAMTGLARHDIALADVLSMYEHDKTRFSKSDYNSLIKFSNSQAEAGGSGVMAKGVEGSFLLEIKSAGLGDYDESYASLADWKTDMTRKIMDSATSVDGNGNVIPGLDPNRIDFLFDEIEKVEEKPYGRKYRQVIEQMKYRILRAEEGGLSFLNTYESKRMMADATESLNSFIDKYGGTRADVGLWRRTEMPKFFNAAAQAAFFNLPASLKKSVSYTTGEDFSVDYKASLVDLYNKLADYKENGRDTSKLEKDIADFELWNKEHGADAGVK